MWHLTYKAMSLTWHMRHIHCHVIQEHTAIWSENHHLCNGKLNQWASRDWGKWTNTKKLTARTFCTFRLCLELQIFQRKNLSENWAWQQPYRIWVRFYLAIQCFSYICLQKFIAIMKWKSHLYWALWFQQVEENIMTSGSVTSSYSLLKHVLQLLSEG